MDRYNFLPSKELFEVCCKNIYLKIMRFVFNFPKKPLSGYITSHQMQIQKRINDAVKSKQKVKKKKKEKKS